MWVGFMVHFGRERAIIIVQYRNIQKWSLFSLKSELDVLVYGVLTFHQPGLLVPP